MTETGTVNDKMPRLSGTGLRKSFGKREVLRGVSVHVDAGEIVGLLGPNGAGKTTCFRIIAGILRPDAGKVSLGDDDMTRLPLYKRARKGIAYLPQEPSIFRGLTVSQNLMAILEVTEPDREKRRPRLETLLAEFGLEKLADSSAQTLSGGEKRRVEVARALVPRPVFIMLDEPFSGIDPIAVEDLMEIVRGLRKRGIGVLITDHSAREVLKICDRIYVMYDGMMIEEGHPVAIAASDRAREVYLGEGFTLG